MTKPLSITYKLTELTQKELNQRIQTAFGLLFEEVLKVERLKDANFKKIQTPNAKTSNFESRRGRTVSVDGD